MDTETQSGVHKIPTIEELAAVKVFPLIVQFKKDVIANVDTPLSWEQLTASDVSFAVVRPLVFKYARLQNPSAPFAALVVRSHFQTLASQDLAHATIQTARANLCELLAIKLLSSFTHDKDKLVWVALLTTSWSPLAGAPASVRADVRRTLGGESDQDIDGDGLADAQNALEMAIATKAKRFIASAVVQTVVTDLYRGDVVFGLTAHRSVLADNYKPRAIEVYDVRKAPFLDHYRLRVPRYGAMLEFINFTLLMATFVTCLIDRSNDRFQLSEAVFCVFAVSFALEEYTAQMEHGWAVYIANLWNVFDTSFIAIFLTYGVLRTYGLYSGDHWYSELGFDILSCGACILFPRLAFFAISNNIVVIALRGMIVEFAFFMGVAAICFSGLLFTLWRLANGSWPVKSIMWLMVQIWFGNTYLSFQQAESFHPVFGPILMTLFAALSNTLLLTILISILSSTFARIDANATHEYLFQFAISTIEGVKSDALFSYQPPFNLLAFMILYPASYVLSPRALHTLNVFLIKLTSFPTLIFISIYERYIRFHAQNPVQLPSGVGRAPPVGFGERMLYGTLPRQLQASFLVDALMGTAAADVYDAIFDVEAGSDAGLWSDDGQDRDDVEEDVQSDPGTVPSAKLDTLAEGPTPGPGQNQGPVQGRSIPARRYLVSMESLKSGSQTGPQLSPGPVQRQRVQSAATATSARQGGDLTLPLRSPDRRPSSLRGSPVSTPRRARFPRVEVGYMGEMALRSPLARLYGAPALGQGQGHVSGQGLGQGLDTDLGSGLLQLPPTPTPQQTQHALELKELRKIRDELKEVQDRQARIENLLLVLTRGMRNETTEGQ